MLVRRVLASFLVAASAPVFMSGAAQAQTTTCQNRLITTFDFQSPTLVSGSALSVGAVYRFSNVATGTDALVSIDAITNGSLNTIDRDTGLIANFQPELNNNNVSSADFTITFVVSGTSTPLTHDFAASGIDIDGNNNNLREYAEFSLPFQEYVLDNPTQLDVNASGPSGPNRIRFESRTPQVAPGIDPTATGNIVSTFYASTSSFQYRIGTLGTGVMTRLTSLDFNCPALNFPTPTPQDPQDFGDAPASYGNPIHDIVAGIEIGATNTVETAPYNSPTASGDTGDDGVTVPVLDRGTNESIDVAVNGTGGRLQAWIDWNNDGSFLTTGDQIATDIQDGGAGDNDGSVNGSIRINVPVPGTASAGSTFARFRWSTQSGVTPTLTAPDGEVEDYQVTISGIPPAPNCPAGLTLVSQTGNAVAIQTRVSVANANRALGALAPAGTTPPDGSSAEMNRNSDQFTLDLGVIIPESGTLVLSAARDNGNQGNNARVDVLFSNDDVSYTSGGTYGTSPATFPSLVQNVLERSNITVPAGGARYIRFDTLNNDDIFIDGVEYSQVCLASALLTSVKSVAMQDPVGAPFAIPGNDVLYTITTTNTGSGPVDADSIFIVDDLPSQVEFYNGDIDDGGPETGAIAFSQTGGAGLTFTEATDVRYSNSGSAPANFAACTYNPVAGYDPAVTYICINPKGAMQSGNPDPTFTVMFRTRIK